MAYKVLSKCPVCEANLKVTRLKCDKCNTVIENDFELSKFSYMDRQQLNFIEVFLRCRGNIKEVEKELGISYPTVRAKLDDVIDALGYSVSKPKSTKNNEILDLLERGEITAEQAIKMLKE